MFRIGLTLLGLVVFAAGARAEERLALLIANEAYEDAVGRLERPHEDAEQIEAALRSVGFETRMVRDATRAGLLDAAFDFAQRLRDAGDGAVGFVYYAGHGAAAEEAGARRNYFIPSDARASDPARGFTERDLRRDGVAVDRVIDELSDAVNAANGASVFIVTDACRNTLRGMRGVGEGTRGFAPVQSPGGLFLAYATTDGAEAPDDGVYAEALADQITRSGQYASRAFSLAARAVAAERGYGSRRPVVSDALNQDVCFVSCPGEHAGLTDDREQLAAGAFSLALASDTVYSWELFLRTYADTSFAEVARLRRDLAEQRGAQPPPEPVSAGALLASLPPPYNTGDPALGERDFMLCASCHRADASGRRGVGPNLYDIVGQPAGAAPGFAYSDALVAADIVWTPEQLDAWIQSPSALVPGTTDAFGGLRDPERRRDLIAYLALQSARVVAEEGAGPPVLDARTTPAATRAPIVENPDALPDFALFRECEACPEMVVLPGGTFTMGAQLNQTDDWDETPAREVTAPRFAIARFETTFSEWDACVADRSCRAIPSGDENDRQGDRGWGRGERPVIEVSWNDITGEDIEVIGYLRWLNGAFSGRPYALPSEAQWEYAARAGGAARYPWGEDYPACNADAPNGANFEPCADNRTHPVGTYPPSEFGLFETQGNVAEWVQDCYADTYHWEQPTDGRAYQFPDCEDRVVRGGSWRSQRGHLRATARYGEAAEERDEAVGFRIVRRLSEARASSERP